VLEEESDELKKQVMGFTNRDYENSVIEKVID
jgi:hypothetical protein